MYYCLGSAKITFSSDNTIVWTSVAIDTANAVTANDGSGTSGDVVAAGKGFVRHMSFYAAASQTITINFYNGTTSRIIKKTTLTTDSTLFFDSESGWSVLDSYGRKLSLSNIIGAPLANGAVPVGDSNGLAVSRVFSGDVVVSNTGVTTVSDDAITLPKIPATARTSLQRKNRIMNGAFNRWDRGFPSVFVTSGQFKYVSDRWATYCVGSSATVSRQEFSVGQIDVPWEPRYWHRVITNSVAGSANFVILLQRIENVRELAGQVATLSFYAKADTNRSLSTEMCQSFGAGGSANVNGIITTKHSLTNVWHRFTVTFTMPSISGKIIGTSDDYLQLIFWLDAGVDYNSRTTSLGQQSGTFDISTVQLEPGNTATDYEWISIPLEQANCQRYWEAIPYDYAWQTYATGWMASTTLGVGVVEYRTTKRKVPQINLAPFGNWSLGTLNNDDICTAIAASPVGVDSFRLWGTVGTGRTAGYGVSIQAYGSMPVSNGIVNMIEIDAEL